MLHLVFWRCPFTHGVCSSTFIYTYIHILRNFGTLNQNFHCEIAGTATREELAIRQQMKRMRIFAEIENGLPCSSGVEKWAMLSSINLLFTFKVTSAHIFLLHSRSTSFSAKLPPKILYVWSKMLQWILD